MFVMIEQDTIRLLREVNAGVKMAVDSIDEVLPSVTNDRLRHILTDSKEEHERLGSKTHELLNRYQDSGKEPNPMAKTMSWIKTNVKLAADPGSGTVADLLIDGCNMGVKSLSRYLNEYSAADEVSKDIAKKLIHMEESLGVRLRDFLS